LLITDFVLNILLFVTKYAYIKQNCRRRKCTIDPVPIWTREVKSSSAEVDILIQVSGTIIPVEVKSGATGSLKSLHKFMDESKNDLAIRLCGNTKNLESVTSPSGKKFRLLNLPYYMAGTISEIAERYL